MQEEVLLETVTHVSRAGESGELFIGRTDVAGKERYYRVFIPSDTIKKWLRELPGSQIAALKVDGKLRCLVHVESFDERGHLKHWTKIGIGHCSLSEAAMLENNLPITH